MTRRAILSSVASASFISTSQAILLPQEARADTLRTALGTPPESKSLLPDSFIPNQPDVEGLQWPPSPLSTKLAQTRIGTTKLSPLTPELSPFANSELYYPDWMFGSWNVTAILKRKTFPYGTQVVTSKSFLMKGYSPRNRPETEGSANDAVRYQVNYYSTLANTLDNQVKVNLGLGVPKSRIIVDRAFVAKDIMNRVYQPVDVVEHVEWDPRQDPTQITVYYDSSLTNNDLERVEIYITARDSEQLLEDIFAASEHYRIVQMSTPNMKSDIVSDVEITSEYILVDPNTITAISRIAVYPTRNPNSREGVSWQQVGGKAVALYDYEIIMKRNLEAFVGPNGQEIQKACVLTPKDVIQCA